MAEQPTHELLAFLSPDTRVDLKDRATHYVMGLTGDPEGRRLLASEPELVSALLALTSDCSPCMATDAYLALINLATEPAAHGALREGLPVLLKRLLDPAFPMANEVCTLLSNLSREEASCRALWAALQQESLGGLPALVDAFCTEDFNPEASLHYLGPLLSNLSQLPEARDFLLDRSRCVVQRLLPFTQYSRSSIRRGGVVGTLRNCCFEYGLPLDLQYLPAEKKREPDPDIRKMLLEAIMLLTATKPGRRIVREKGTYLILRELHKWEKDPGVLAACEKLIQVLIGDEPEAGMENLLEVEIPAEVEEQLQRLDLEEEGQLQQHQQGRSQASGSEGLQR
uniref:Protein HGH1 homolog n=2 Tax=Podarcis muralis TaxID=64176 RepID=A0A670IW19_PODMU